MAIILVVIRIETNDDSDIDTTVAPAIREIGDVIANGTNRLRWQCFLLSPFTPLIVVDISINGDMVQHYRQRGTIIIVTDYTEMGSFANIRGLHILRNDPMGGVFK